jgi:hypothetical protein
MPEDEDLRFKVVRVNGHDEIVARAVNLIIGRAAFETARAPLSRRARGLPGRRPRHCTE